MNRTSLTLAALLAGALLLWAIVIWPPSKPSLAKSSVETSAVEAPAVQPATAPVPAKHEPPIAQAPAPPEAPPEKSAPPVTEPPSEDPFAAAQGPVDEYRDRFQNEARDAAAKDAENQVRAAFEPEPGQPNQFRTVLCRQTLCRVMISPSPDQGSDYSAAISRMSHDFESTFAALPVAQADPSKPRMIELYLQRKPRAP
jgi:hypothetical protein